MIQNLARRNCSRARCCRRRCRRNRSAATPKAASPAPRRCRVNGDTWQVMRLSRNRYWGHPSMIALLEAARGQRAQGQGPAGQVFSSATSASRAAVPHSQGHASHQIGLDADIWLTPMPDRKLSREEREETSAVMMVRDDRLDIDPRVFTPRVMYLSSATRPRRSRRVQRIFVNAAIKKALCREAKGDRSWLSKISHGGLAALPLPHPHGVPCRQPAMRGDRSRNPRARAAGPLTSRSGSRTRCCIRSRRPGHQKPRPPMTLAQLPTACVTVLNAPDSKQQYLRRRLCLLPRTAL